MAEEIQFMNTQHMIPLIRNKVTVMITDFLISTGSKSGR